MASTLDGHRRGAVDAQPLVPATYLGRIAQAAIGTPAGDSPQPGSALSQTRPCRLNPTHGRRQRR